MRTLLFVLLLISAFPSINAKCEGILVTGGQNEQGTHEDTLEFYSPFWMKSGILQVKLLTPRESHATIALSSTKILIAGGETGNAHAVPDTEVIDLHTGSVVRGPPMAFSRRKPGFAIFKEKVWLCGGDDNDMQDINSCETYHDGSWSPAPTMIGKRWAPAMAVYEDALYVIGGYDWYHQEWQYLKSVERITGEGSQWQEVASMNTARYRLAAQVLGDFIYACGGHGGGDEYLDSCEKYDPKRDQWKDVHGRMNDGHSNFPMIAMHGLLYSLGGFNGHTSLKSIERYNASSDTWDTVGDLVHGRSYSTGALLSNC